MWHSIILPTDFSTLDNFFNPSKNGKKKETIIPKSIIIFDIVFIHKITIITQVFYKNRFTMAYI